MAPDRRGPIRGGRGTVRDRQVRLLLRATLSVPAHWGRLGEFRHRNAARGDAGEVEAVQSASTAAEKLTVAPAGLAGHSGSMLAARITLAHFSVSSAINLPKSAGELAIAVLPRSASRALILGSATPA